MAICIDCKQDMLTATGCTVPTVMIDGKRYERGKYEREDPIPDQPCHDCNVQFGQYHHLGCDMERCPKCGGQLISCGCWED